MPIAPLWHVTLHAVQDWWQDNCLRLAASLAYYTALSLAPLVLLIVANLANTSWLFRAFDTAGESSTTLFGL